MSFLLPESQKIPLSKLSYGFRKRLITLAPLRIVNELSNLCPNVKKFRLIQPQAYDHVFMTDNDEVFRWASKDTFLFRVFKILHQFALLRFLLDGLVATPNPMWEDVVSVQDMRSKEQWIYVEKTLILFCNSIDGYETVIPYICGPYTRLILHGNIRWDQVIRLIHPGVTKMRINARIQIPEQTNDYFANYIAKHVRGITSSVLIVSTEPLTPELIYALHKASERHEMFTVDFFSVTSPV
uniref:F-box domain-containing protein n=1 Tax=Panagrellus redivivus TaxID=6233 RepID=A0A7E4VU62_PANRE